MQAIVFLPAFVAGLVVWCCGYRKALVFVALPTLLILPTFYTWDLPSAPDMNFWNFLFALVFAGWLLSSDRQLYRFHFVDLLVLGFVLLSVHSEASTKTIGDARNLACQHFMGVIVPYLFGRVVARHRGLLVGTVAILVVVGSAIGLVAPYEARMGVNPFDFLRKLWPTALAWDGALYRAGFRRVAGPFAHPICQGFFFSMVFPLSLWLRRYGFLGGKWRQGVILLGQIAGLLFAGSRGPILGTLIAIGIVGLGWARRRALLLGGIFSLLLLCAPFLLDGVSTYLSVTRGEATTATQETAAYRKELLENYWEVVMESPWLGYGRNEIPVVKGQKSIDNQYLFLSLQHGLPVAVLFLLLLLLPGGLLFLRILRAPANPTVLLGWCLVGCLAGAIFTQITVFAGTQTAQVLLLLQGIAVSTIGRVENSRAPVGSSPHTI